MLQSVLWNELGRVVLVAGMPIGLIVFIWGVRHLRGTLENSIHVSLLNRYQDGLRTVAESWASISKRPPSDSPASFADETRTRVMASLLVTLFEEAFLLMYRHSWPMRRNRHWMFWNQRLYEWCAHCRVPRIVAAIVARARSRIRSLLLSHPRTRTLAI